MDDFYLDWNDWKIKFFFHIDFLCISKMNFFGAIKIYLGLQGDVGNFDMLVILGMTHLMKFSSNSRVHHKETLPSTTSTQYNPIKS